MILQAVKKNPTLSEKAYRIMRDAIVINRLEPGEILTEEQLSEMLNISRTPVRAAINRLLGEGLLSDQGKGFIVTSMTPEEIDSISMLRKAVEPLAVSKLCGKVTPEMVKNLRKVVEKQRAVILSSLASSEDFLKYIDFDYEFHTTLAGWTEDRFILDIVERINTHSCRGLILSSSLPFAYKDAVDEHAAILDCLESGDCEAASAAMLKHVSNVQQRYFKKSSKT